MHKCLVSPSMLAADFANIQRDVEMLNNSEADYIHIDIMDGVFVPNISFGFPVTKAIAKYAKKPLDFHLMIQDADAYLEPCKNSGAEIITVHYEACTHLHRTIGAIHDLGVKAGVALNPHTPVDVLKEIIADIDLVLIMSVNPGFGGQKFIEHTFSKVERLGEMSKEVNPDLLIEIDGGVSSENAKRLVQVGANMLVAGSFVFNSDNPSETISALKNV
ncbi:MAG: ribulose-phosphate 3-epimerase [Flammeovirgaceae bacterium]|nr:ribulose-phosphate 3-epimerase [Flammeovirgaceae bacterium]MBR08900.1 ribulose-phosphate 3-epimerase [Rickettsiales bacterium]HCX21545.1 ribulose-phosphate 3-epimerase [Cytophagales bacterium]